MSDHDEPQGRDCARGQRVSLADGAEVVLPTWTRRGLARAIDALAAAVFFTIVVLVGAAVEFPQYWLLGGGYRDDFERHWSVWFAAGYAVIVLYEVLAVTLKGQTLGKSTAGIMVMSTSGGRVPLGRSALRWFVPAAASLSGVAAVLWALADSSESVWEWLSGLTVFQVWFGASAMWLLLYLVALSDPHRRGPHDWAAGTIVVIAESSVMRR
ncbi:RDD family protein [Candidatus Poriferisodalis sp.]|uniref:RDD family protein n=1 Tax=Candidatus Poriferisodalis sp. TaxID=3101277 RepID=UPI003B02C773